jgi:DUF1680 family protein
MSGLREIDTSVAAVAAVLPTSVAIARLSPVLGSGATVTGGFWAERLRLNRERTLPHGFEQLRHAGNLSNLALAAGANGRYRTLGQAIGLDYPFLDTDVYKWLEAVGWELGRQPDPALAAAADEAIGLIRDAQRPDGYLNSFVQVVAPGREYQDLAWGHELYCVGHLIQAAVAWNRALGDDRLLEVAVRAADSVDRVLGPGGHDGIDGHPEIEMALVELYRVTGETRYLELAARMVDLRGTGILGQGRFGSAYWQDHARVSAATSVAGHAVRQLYLDSGVVDVATELGDTTLLDAVHRRWQDMIATRTYLTGGVGSRHKDEAFGDPFELPPDRAYAETCGSIASVMLAWRLLLATGDPACADVIERTIYNGVLPGVSLEGTEFFYENPLQRRTARAAAASGHGGRARWFPCACCPPNLMRTLASWEHYLATTDPTGIQIHQYAAAELRAATAAGPVRLAIETDYPWDGRVRVTILEAPDRPWSLSLRVPSWSRTTTVQGPDSGPRAVLAGTPWESGQRQWHAGESIELELDMRPRITTPDPRIDAVRATVAMERGPLVYCIETSDLPSGTTLEEVALDPASPPVAVTRPGLGDGMVGLDAQAIRQRHRDAAWPYDPSDPYNTSNPGDTRDPRIGVGGNDGDGTARGSSIDLHAIPYFAWANRSAEAMRVWIPVHQDGAADPQ